MSYQPNAGEDRYSPPNSPRLTLVRGARQLLTLRGPANPRRGPDLKELHIIRDGAVLIRNGIIEEIGPTRRLENMTTARAAREVDASGRVVMPSFVDSQTSLISLDPAHSETYGEVFGAGENFSTRRMIARVEPLTQGMARHGTGSIEAHVEGGTDETEIKVLRIHKQLYEGPVHVSSATFASRPLLIEQLQGRTLPELWRRNLAKVAEVLCGPSAFPIALAREYLAKARSLGYLIKVRGEVTDADNAVILALETQAHAVSNLKVTDHSLLQELGRSAVIPTLLPGIDFLKGRQYDAGRELADCGAAIALASGFYPGYNPNFNMQWIVALAIRKLGLSVEEAISAATINGAHAAGLDGQCGSIEPGKSADMIILNLDDYHELASRAGMNNVYMTIHRGEEVYREGAVRVVDDLKMGDPRN